MFANLREERVSQYLYRIMEEVESEKYAKLFRRLRSASEKQAGIWEEEIRKAGGVIPQYKPGIRVRLVGWLIRHLGPRRILPVLASMKVRGLAVYRAEGSVEEISESSASAGLPEEESWHRASRGGGALRAAVFGINDGLVSNASLIIGVAGADPNPKVILLAGVAGLLAGGFSMAAGEYISVRTQRELLERQIALEKEEMRTMPGEEVAELSLIYETKGIPPAEARVLAERIVSDPEHGLNTLAREELGLDPQGLASPIVASLASFFSFAVGALIPLIPYLFITGRTALLSTIILMELGLCTVGGLMSLFTGRSVWWSAIRMAILGSAAAAATFAIGKLLGASVS